MKSLRLQYVLLFFFPIIASSQVNISDAFQKTVKKISRERVKNEVIEWITESDPVTGIVARDLIAQIIDNNKNEEALLKSTTNVLTTMLFVGAIKKQIEPMVEKYPAILNIAETADWNREQLLAYSALYIYHSERLKKQLYVSRAVMEMQEEKKKIESFSFFDSSKGYDVKWLTVTYAQFIKLRGSGEKLNLTMDVRALEFVQYALSELLTNKTHAIASIDSALHALKKSFSDRGEKIQAIEQMESAGDALHTVYTLYERYITAFASANIEKAFFMLDYRRLDDAAATLETDAVPKIQKLNNALADPFTDLITWAKYPYVDPEQTKKIIIGITKELIEQWIASAHRNGWKAEYTFSLAGTAFTDGPRKEIDFTILDQFRFARHWESSTIYLFAGGIIDPILKNTIYTTPMKLYLAGFGFQCGSTSASLDVGIPYSDFKTSNFRYGISFGYEIPVSDLLD
ncbi:MAG: hypothetical protein M0R68_01670 [Bacteroidetes bacterium]|nr:hypothetical protein [Bacteroidota bacterium]